MASALSAIAAAAVAAPFLALASVDFAPSFVFDDPVLLATAQLVVFVLAAINVPATVAGALGVFVWLAHGMALRIRPTGRPALTQSRGGQARVGSASGGGREGGGGGLRVPLPT